MDNIAKNIFQQFLVEEFEKRSERKMDVVAMKRKQFNTLVEKAEGELRNKSYATATRIYLNVMHFLKMEPYPDELKCSQEAEFTIKCCFCYSALMDQDRFNDEELNSILLDVITELNNRFKKRLFPMFLLVLLNFYRKNWFATLTWCNEIESYIEEEEENMENFQELLPEISQIRLEVEKCEQTAFFGYGEKLTTNPIFKSRFERFKTWSCKLDDFTVNKMAQLQTPVSDTELHVVFHEEIFPIWCLTNGQEHKFYYNNKFASNCPPCIRAKLYNGIPRRVVEEDEAKFEQYIAQCANFYQKFAQGNIEECKKAKEAALKKKVSTVMTQTEKIKTNHKINQTEGTKTKNMEVQVGNDSQLLNAILEIKNKCLTLQEKKDDTIAKLNRKITELQDKMNKDVKANKNAGQEFEKETSSLKFEIQKLKEQMAEKEKKQKTEHEKNLFLQKLLVEQINDKYNSQKRHYKSFEKQALFMVTYLNDLSTFLTPKSIPDINMCRQSIEIWENELHKIKRTLDELNTFYQNFRADMIKSNIYDTPWPEVPELPKLENNMIFQNFKSAIRNIIQTEERLYWNNNNDYQPQMQPQMQRPPPLGPANYLYNLPPPQFTPPQNNYVRPQHLSYFNTPMPAKYRQEMPVKERFSSATPSPPATANKEPKQALEQKPKMSKSTEFLDKTGGAQRRPAPVRTQETAKKGRKKAEDKKEGDTILLDYVLERCPGASEQEVTMALLHLLDENKGTLSNLSNEKIVEEVKIILRMKKQTAWVTPKSPHVEWHNEHVEKECTICFEEFSSQDKYTLPCQHEYHKECIRKWLKTSSVCPICRIHSVIDDEFPPLH